ncbi:hypothetical protein BDF14DRAFT_1797891 [Spinellus fusiger]|nr:hypothetical protein BDF14DRAFT_1797891 [Spinellus fusiger]
MIPDLPITCLSTPLVHLALVCGANFNGVINLSSPPSKNLEAKKNVLSKTLFFLFSFLFLILLYFLSYYYYY